MPVPLDIQEVKRLLGMVNFTALFVPNLSTVTAPLRDLLKGDVTWYWSYEHDQAVQTLKDILSKEPVLKVKD